MLAGVSLDQLRMFAVYRDAEPPGPAGRWMIERLKQCGGTTGHGLD